MLELGKAKHKVVLRKRSRKSSPQSLPADNPNSLDGYYLFVVTTEAASFLTRTVLRTFFFFFFFVLVVQARSSFGKIV